ncbi:MAG: GTP 3',8-cyclase MoaA [Desulfobacterales bacterium]
MSTPHLTDPYRRHLNYLRISVTDRCNLKCAYCVPRELIPKLLHRDILRYEELLRIVRIGVSLGITKVRVTGGEPLVRKGVSDFLAELTAIDALTDVSLTTNGVLLGQYLDRLRQAGIRRINVSLDTLKRRKFEQITGVDAFETVFAGILAALEAGFSPVKINAVALRGINEDELVDLARLSIDYPLQVRFIEHMPIGNAMAGAQPPLLAPEIRERIRPLGELTPVKSGGGDGPAERYRLPEAAGEIGLIRPLSHHFCSHCNRLRLTASGMLRPCLLSDYEEDLRTPLRKGLLDEDLKSVFLRAVSRKPRQHALAEAQCQQVSGQMCAIGG